MTLHSSQLGRFGQLAMSLANGEPDRRASHLLASNGILTNPRPTLTEVLDSKGFKDPNGQAWLDWLVIFQKHQNHFMARGLSLLRASCPISWKGQVVGTCLHEL